MLRDLKSDLKNLRYGKDRIGGGSSNQPYIQTPIPENANTLQKLKIDAAGFSWDFPVRGGTLSLIRSAEDVSRITQFLLDGPRGPLFIAKQVGLQLTNPKIETGKTFGIENTRIYNLGVNTLAQVGLNAFGTHLDRPGALPIIGEKNKYASVVDSKNRLTPNENRLVKLYENFNVGYNNNYRDFISQKALDTYNKLTERLNKLNNSRLGRFANRITEGGFGRSIEGFKEKAARDLEPKYYKIDEYGGGPGSVYGIGNTTLNRYVFTDRHIYEEDRNAPQLEINYRNLLGLSNLLYPLNIIDDREQSLVFTEEPFVTKAHPFKHTEGTSFTSAQIYDQIIGTVNGKDYTNSHLNSLTFDYQLIKQQTLESKLLKPDFREVINKEFGAKLPSTNYAKFNMETRIGIGNPGKPTRDRSKISIIDPDTIDQINALPLFKEEIQEGGKITDGPLAGKSTRDLIKFRFEAVDNDNPQKTVKIVFRAFIEGFKDGIDADWENYHYNGRGEEFFTYKRFKRKSGFNFKIAAQSRSEMKPLYQKLNYLMSNLTPDYSTQGFMRGPFMLITIGNWFYRTPCILHNININVDKNYPWEIAMDEPEAGEDLQMAELPQILDVGIQFTPIHNFIPRKGPTFPLIHTPTNPNYNWLKPDEFNDLR